MYKKSAYLLIVFLGFYTTGLSAAQAVFDSVGAPLASLSLDDLTQNLSKLKGSLARASGSTQIRAFKDRIKAYEAQIAKSSADITAAAGATNARFGAAQSLLAVYKAAIDTAGGAYDDADVGIATDDDIVIMAKNAVFVPASALSDAAAKADPTYDAAVFESKVARKITEYTELRRIAQNDDFVVVKQKALSDVEDRLGVVKVAAFMASLDKKINSKDLVDFVALHALLSSSEVVNYRTNQKTTIVKLEQIYDAALSRCTLAFNRVKADEENDALKKQAQDEADRQRLLVVTVQQKAASDTTAATASLAAAAALAKKAKAEIEAAKKEAAEAKAKSAEEQAKAAEEAQKEYSTKVAEFIAAGQTPADAAAAATQFLKDQREAQAKAKADAAAAAKALQDAADAAAAVAEASSAAVKKAADDARAAGIADIQANYRDYRIDGESFIALIKKVDERVLQMEKVAEEAEGSAAERLAARQAADEAKRKMTAPQKEAAAKAEAAKQAAEEARSMPFPLAAVDKAVATIVIPLDIVGTELPDLVFKRKILSEFIKKQQAMHVIATIDASGASVMTSALKVTDAVGVVKVLEKHLHEMVIDLHNEMFIKELDVLLYKHFVAQEGAKNIKTKYQPYDVVRGTILPEIKNLVQAHFSIDDVAFDTGSAKDITTFFTHLWLLTLKAIYEKETDVDALHTASDDLVRTTISAIIAQTPTASWDQVFDDFCELGMNKDFLRARFALYKDNHLLVQCKYYDVLVDDFKEAVKALFFRPESSGILDPAITKLVAFAVKQQKPCDIDFKDIFGDIATGDGFATLKTKMQKILKRRFSDRDAIQARFTKMIALVANKDASPADYDRFEALLGEFNAADAAKVAALRALLIDWHTQQRAADTTLQQLGTKLVAELNAIVFAGQKNARRVVLQKLLEFGKNDAVVAAAISSGVGQTLWKELLTSVVRFSPSAVRLCIAKILLNNPDLESINEGADADLDALSVTLKTHLEPLDMLDIFTVVDGERMFTTLFNVDYPDSYFAYCSEKQRNQRKAFAEKIAALVRDNEFEDVQVYYARLLESVWPELLLTEDELKAFYPAGTRDEAADLIQAMMMSSGIGAPKITTLADLADTAKRDKFKKDKPWFDADFMQFVGLQDADATLLGTDLLMPKAALAATTEIKDFNKLLLAYWQAHKDDADGTPGALPKKFKQEIVNGLIKEYGAIKAVLAGTMALKAWTTRVGRENFKRAYAWFNEEMATFLGLPIGLPAEGVDPDAATSSVLTSAVIDVDKKPNELLNEFVTYWLAHKGDVVGSAGAIPPDFKKAVEDAIVRREKKAADDAKKAAEKAAVAAAGGSPYTKKHPEMHQLAKAFPHLGATFIAARANALKQIRSVRQELLEKWVTLFKQAITAVDTEETAVVNGKRFAALMQNKGLDSRAVMYDAVKNLFERMKLTTIDNEKRYVDSTTNNSFKFAKPASPLFTAIEDIADNASGATRGALQVLLATLERINALNAFKLGALADFVTKPDLKAKMDAIPDGDPVLQFTAPVDAPSAAISVAAGAGSTGASGGSTGGGSGSGTGSSGAAGGGGSAAVASPWGGLLKPAATKSPLSKPATAASGGASAGGGGGSGAGGGAGSAAAAPAVTPLASMSKDELKEALPKVLRAGQIDQITQAVAETFKLNDPQHIVGAFMQTALAAGKSTPSGTLPADAKIEEVMGWLLPAGSTLKAYLNTESILHRVVMSKDVNEHAVQQLVRLGASTKRHGSATAGSKKPLTLLLENASLRSDPDKTLRLITALTGVAIPEEFTGGASIDN